MIRRIALVGMMGAGKSVVGPILAGRIGAPFLDLDERIEKAEGRSIPAIFAERGESAFRAIETERLREALEAGESVIATGGGVLLAGANRELLRRWGRTVYLRAPVAVLAGRLGEGAGAGRPLLAGGPAEARLASILAERAPFYEAADLAVDTEGRTPEEVAIRIEEWANDAV